MVRFQISLLLFALAAASRLEVIQPIPRNQSAAINPEHGPCGNMPKGPSHLLAEPGSLNPVIWSVKDYSEDGRCVVNLATEPEVKHKTVLHPNDGSADANGWFDCGRNTTYAERKVFVLPKETVCDACTLQLIFSGSNSTEFTCVDLQINNEFVPGCWEKCENGGVCVNSQCECVIGYYGDYCERTDEESPENLLLWFLTFCLLLFVLGVLATYMYVNTYKLGSRTTFLFFINYLPCFMRNPDLDYVDWREAEQEGQQPTS
mmetsp:Transcript_27587/g.49745  ORF Transcript_27587/g.49745 Transcript_27587/m.49745 type:complete len:261 (-) Transcript_27587:326-1108(-)